MTVKNKIKMRQINSNQIENKIKELFLKANYHICKDLIN